MSAEVANRNGEDLCEVLAYAGEHFCACDGEGTCIPCKALRLLQERMPRMPLKEAVEIIEATYAGDTCLEEWAACGMPTDHRYAAMRTVLDAARRQLEAKKTLPF